MSLLQLNTAIVEYFNTSGEANITTLRNSVSSIWDTSAPPETSYPIFTYENISNNIEQSFCTDIAINPIDFSVYADSKAQSLELAYYARKGFDNVTYSLSGGYDNIGVLYDGMFSSYSAVDDKWITTVSFNYTVISPVDSYQEIDYNPEIQTLVMQNSGLWATEEYVFYFDNPQNYIAYGEGTLSQVIPSEINIDTIYAEASGVGTLSSTTFGIYKDSTLIGDVTFPVGTTVGIVNITDTIFEAGDSLSVTLSAADVDLDNVSIIISGQRQ